MAKRVLSPAHAVLDRESRVQKARKIARLVQPRLVQPVRSVLDLGTGSGVIAETLAEVFPDARVTSVDVVDERITRNGYKFVKAEGVMLPFPDDSFDLVLTNHVIEHVGDREAQLNHLKEIRRVLSPSGVGYLAVAHRWVINEPHYHLPFLSWMPPKLASAYLQWTRDVPLYDCDLPSQRRLRRLLSNAGLRTEDATLEAVRLYLPTEGTSPAAQAVAAFPTCLLRLLRPLVPTQVYVLRAR